MSHFCIFSYSSNFFKFSFGNKKGIHVFLSNNFMHKKECEMIKCFMFRKEYVYCQFHCVVYQFDLLWYPVLVCIQLFGMEKRKYRQKEEKVLYHCLYSHRSLCHFRNACLLFSLCRDVSLWTFDVFQDHGIHLGSRYRIIYRFDFQSE